VYWLRMPLPFALDHINLWLLEDGEGWTAVDSGIGRAEVRALWEQHFVTTMGGRPLERVIVTHYHPDHMGLATWLSERFDTRVWTTEAEFLTAQLVHARTGAWRGGGLGRHYAAHGLDETTIDALLSRGNTYAFGVPEVPGSFYRIRAGDVVAIGRHRWRVMIGYGHAPEHACLYSRELGVLISGDQVLPRISTNVSVWPTEPEGNPLGLYLSSLDQFEQLPAATLVLPSHNLVFRGLHGRVQALRAHHRERLEELLAACRQPRTAADMLPVLFRRKLDLSGTFFAMGESIAHLNHLWHRGRLSRSRGADGVYRFQAKSD
jgi:glyoxylase-like metal-dependent hydrolase (beta-lactamase superfamily II)